MNRLLARLARPSNLMLLDPDRGNWLVGRVYHDGLWPIAFGGFNLSALPAVEVPLPPPALGWVAREVRSIDVSPRFHREAGSSVPVVLHLEWVPEGYLLVKVPVDTVRIRFRDGAVLDAEPQLIPEPPAETPPSPLQDIDRWAHQVLDRYLEGAALWQGEADTDEERAIGTLVGRWQGTVLPRLEACPRDLDELAARVRAGQDPEQVAREFGVDPEPLWDAYWAMNLAGVR